MSIKGLMLSEKASLNRLKTTTNRMSFMWQPRKGDTDDGGRSVVVISYG